MANYWTEPPRGRILVALALLCLLGAAACSSPPPTPAAVSINLKNYAVAAQPATARAGSIIFNITNAGPDQHEFVVVKSDKPADQLPLDSNGNVDEAAAGKVGDVEAIDASKSTTLTVNLAAGHYVLICNRPGHYQLGMHTDFTVSP